MPEIWPEIGCGAVSRFGPAASCQRLAAGTTPGPAGAPRQNPPCPRRRAAPARAARPTVGAKEEAEALLLRTGPDAPSNAIVRATLLGLDLPGHEHLLTGVAERYLDDVTALWAARPGDLAQTVAEGIFPSWAVDPGSVERFRAVVADDSHPAALRRIISEQTADMIRALAARAVDTAESG